MRAFFVAVASLSLASIARAEPPADLRPYVFSLDGTLLQPRTAAIESGAGYNGITGSGGGLQPDDARRALGWITAAVGVVDRVQLQGTIAFGDDPANGFGLNQARIDLAVQALKWHKRFPVALSFGVGYQADAIYDHAITGVAMASAYLGRVNLTLNVRAAHYFAAGRDPVDVFVTAGVLVRATDWLRVGAEYVGEELEGVSGGDLDDSPGGRHYVGPTAAVFFVKHRLRLNATAGVVVLHGDAGPLARGSLAYLF